MAGALYSKHLIADSDLTKVIIVSITALAVAIFDAGLTSFLGFMCWIALLPSIQSPPTYESCGLKSLRELSSGSICCTFSGPVRQLRQDEPVTQAKRSRADTDNQLGNDQTTINTARTNSKSLVKQADPLPLVAPEHWMLPPKLRRAFISRCLYILMALRTSVDMSSSETSSHLEKLQEVAQVCGALRLAAHAHYYNGPAKSFGRSELMLLDQLAEDTVREIEAHSVSAL